MAENDTVLTARKARFVLAVMTSASITEAATTAGIGERAAWRYL